jgi:Sulfotransferase family
MGFIRSGTTLLEKVLSQGPEVENLEERETLVDLTARYLMRDEDIDRLARLDDPALEEARRLYWQRVGSYGARPEGKVFIDKQPLNAFNLPLIVKLFPDAKILFALRDPRDVILSCFRRHFQTNPNTFELLSLGDAAAFYDAVMRLTEIYREKLPLDLYHHRYEDMIADFEGSVRRVCKFIGMEWTDGMRDFAASAAAEKIRSPSAAQVRRGLYAEAVESWRRYANHMAPALPILQPWVEKFGYPAE